MKSAILLLCMLAAPAMASTVDLEFGVVSGSMTIDISPDGVAVPDPVTVGLDGTFVATFEDDGHIGESDTFFLGDAHLANSETIMFVSTSVSTVTIAPGDASFIGFVNPSGPGHVPTSVYTTDVIFSGTFVTTGLLETTFDTTTTGRTPSPFNITVAPMSAGASDVVTMTMTGTFAYLLAPEAIAQTLTFDFIIDLVATAHVVPDPALGGMTTLGIFGAGAWLRHRRG